MEAEYHKKGDDGRAEHEKGTAEGVGRHAASPMRGMI